MWPKKYKDYPEDESLKKYRVEPGKGIQGCEMHELNGYGTSQHRYKRRKNIIEKLLSYLWGSEK